MSAVAAAPRLEMRGISKRFGATAALRGVDLEVSAGEILALVGENGAGKSTLMKILAGALRPDSGSTRLDGQLHDPADPAAARRAGVAMIYQELNLAPHLTVEENITLGVEDRRWGFIRRRRWLLRIREALGRLDHPEISPETRVLDLSPAARQLVEIARALVADARVVVMDEPTSSLGGADIEHLFAVIESLRREGRAVIYISHFLEEVQRIADRYQVLRDGRAVGSGRSDAATADDLVALMVGRELEEMFPRVPHEIGEPILELRGLTGRPLPREIDLELRRGEILGIAGLVGAGRTELLRTAFGLDSLAGGSVVLDGVALRRPDPPRSLSRGMGLASEDRQGEGLAPNLGVADNLLMSRLRPYARWGWLSGRNLDAVAAEWIERLGIRATSSRVPVAALSGGNQQKVALARLLHHDVEVLLLDEPTRGVDVGSKAEIYRLIGELAARGKAICLVSSYTPELLGICDTIAVMHRGRLGPPRPVTRWSEHAILSAATLGEDGEA